MTLALDIYATKDSQTTQADLRSYLSSLPHFRLVEDAQVVYENEDTGVHFTVDSEPVERDVEGFRSLEMSFIVNYGRAEFFGLEIFPLIANICNKLDLFIDIEQKGKLQKLDVDRLHKAWLKTNDGFLRELQEELSPDDMDLAYMPRQASNELWRFLFNKKALQDKLTSDGKDIYVSQPLFFQEGNRVITVVAWPAVIPITLPPHTDFVFLTSGVKKHFFLIPYSKPIGYISMERILEVASKSFVRHKDGSLELNSIEANKIRSKILQLQPNFDPKHMLGKSISYGSVIDVLA